MVRSARLLSPTGPGFSGFQRFPTNLSCSIPKTPSRRSDPCKSAHLVFWSFAAKVRLPASPPRGLRPRATSLNGRPTLLVDPLEKEKGIDGCDRGPGGAGVCLGGSAECHAAAGAHRSGVHRGACAGPSE